MGKSRSTMLVALVLLGGLMVSGASAATITWDAPQYITSDSEVATTGTLFKAIADVNPAVGGGSPITVNGVTFSDTTNGFLNPPFEGSDVETPPQGAGLSSNYKDLLDSIFYQSNNNGGPLTLSGLTLGQNYLVQVWATFSHPVRAGMTETIGGVTVHINSGADGSGAGQYITGAFTADAATQDIAILGSTSGPGTEYGPLPCINAYQVRAVPEPSTLILLALGMMGVATYVWRRR